MLLNSRDLGAFWRQYSYFIILFTITLLLVLFSFITWKSRINSARDRISSDLCQILGANHGLQGYYGITESGLKRIMNQKVMPYSNIAEIVFASKKLSENQNVTKSADTQEFIHLCEKNAFNKKLDRSLRSTAAYCFVSASMSDSGELNDKALSALNYLRYIPQMRSSVILIEAESLFRKNLKEEGRQKMASLGQDSGISPSLSSLSKDFVSKSTISG